MVCVNDFFHVDDVVLCLYFQTPSSYPFLMLIFPGVLYLRLLAHSHLGFLHGSLLKQQKHVLLPVVYLDQIPVHLTSRGGLTLPDTETGCTSSFSSSETTSFLCVLTSILSGAGTTSIVGIFGSSLCCSV